MDPKIWEEGQLGKAGLKSGGRMPSSTASDIPVSFKTSIGAGLNLSDRNSEFWKNSTLENVFAYT